MWIKLFSVGPKKPRKAERKNYHPSRKQGCYSRQARLPRCRNKNHNYNHLTKLTLTHPCVLALAIREESDTGIVRCSGRQASRSGRFHCISLPFKRFTLLVLQLSADLSKDQGDLQHAAWASPAPRATPRTQCGSERLGGLPHAWASAPRGPSRSPAAVWMGEAGTWASSQPCWHLQRGVSGALRVRRRSSKRWAIPPRPQSEVRTRSNDPDSAVA